MKRFVIASMLLALFGLVSCGGDEHTKMPWEDDLDNGGDQNPPAESDAEVGQPLPVWSEGSLDIHFINSGRGECTFYILPDGTTLLVDAGEIVVSDGTEVPQRPNANTRPYSVYANYIRHFMPEGHTSIDWCAPSHFHIDHIGSSAAATETSPAGYRLSGLMALYNEVPFDHVLDMGYPDYGADTTIPAMDGELADDWQTFVAWAVANKGMTANRFQVGETQITLQYAPDSYTGFRIFNIVANGYAWNLDSSTGKGAIVNAKADKGNPASCGFHLSYGKFDYMACGDLTSGPQNRVAYYYRDFIPQGGLEVFKAHHHLSSNAWGSQMQSCEFSPQVIINHSFYNSQPDIALLTSILDGTFTGHAYSWTKDLFTTNVHPETLVANADLFQRLGGYNGHIVVRVAPGGDEFYVYVLDDTDFNYKVKSIHGPYRSK